MIKKEDPFDTISRQLFVIILEKYACFLKWTVEDITSTQDIFRKTIPQFDAAMQGFDHPPFTDRLEKILNELKEDIEYIRIGAKADHELLERLQQVNALDLNVALASSDIAKKM